MKREFVVLALVEDIPRHTLRTVLTEEERERILKIVEHLRKRREEKK